MADFSVLQAAMSRIRQENGPTTAPQDARARKMSQGSQQSSNGAPPPDLSDEPWFVGHASQLEVEKALINAPAGDFVVRESSRTPGAFVLMVKLTAATGIQKRIIYSRGFYRMDGNVETFTTMKELLRTEPMCRRPAKELLSGRGLSSRNASQTSNGTGQRVKGTRSMLEAAMNYAESGNLQEAYRLYHEAAQAGATERNLKMTREYIDSFRPVMNPNSAMEAPVQKKQPEARDGFFDMEVHIRKTVEAAKLDLGGTALCSITPDNKIIVVPMGSTAVDPRHVWPLQFLRRYGRDDGVFYFECGRRCASGPATLYFETPHEEALFSAADVKVRQIKANAQAAQAAKAAEQQAMIAKLREQKRIQEEKEAEARERAIREHEERAMAEAKAQMKQEAEAKKLAMLQRELDEKKKEAESKLEPDYEHRAAVMNRQKSMAKIRHDKAKKIETNKKEEEVVTKKVEIKQGVDIFKDQAADPYEGKSKIWKALNPQPLAFQTAKDRRERTEAVSVGLIGQRNYTFLNTVIHEEDASNSPRPSMAVIEDTDKLDEDQGDSTDKAERTVDLEDVEPEESEEEEEEDINEEDLGALDDELLQQLQQGRAARAEEEKKRREELAAQYRKQKEEEQKIIDHELALIAARRKLEAEELERKRDAAVAEAQERLATELTFDFTWDG
eukprot:m.29133 g.29133  ORF g.29133 m.29133 type:complete len:673 (+) comp8067_c0_seq1:338-2356(+)